MIALPQSVTHRLSCFSSLLPQALALRLLFALGCMLLLLASHAYAAKVTVDWVDPHSDPAEVGGYYLYYWQHNWDAPARVNVGKQTSYTLTDLEAGQTYYIAVTAHDGNGGKESTFSNVVDTNGVIFAVNAGGPEYVSTSGTLYEADTQFTGGQTATTIAAISGTEDDFLYQSERYGNFSYAVPLVNGNYVVTLQFAERYWSAVGKRVFDVKIEGTEVQSNLDLVAKVGPNAAYDVTIPVSVTDGMLNISFHTDVDNAKVSTVKVAAEVPLDIPSPQRLKVVVGQ